MIVARITVSAAVLMTAFAAVPVQAAPYQDREQQRVCQPQYKVVRSRVMFGNELVEMTAFWRLDVSCKWHYVSGTDCVVRTGQCYPRYGYERPPWSSEKRAYRPGH